MKQKNKYIFSAFILLFLSFIVVSGCTSTYGNIVTQNEFTFIDSLGRNITIEQPPKRVAALIGSFADVWTLSGGTVCAAPEDAWDDFGLNLPEAVNIGGAHSPNLELLLAADPDFVIASASTASNVEMKDVLENAGITVAYFDVDNFDDYLNMLDICTDITGRKDLYGANGLEIQKEVTSIINELQARNVTNEKRTVLLLRAHSGSVKAKGSEGTILGEMLADLGCINIADSDNSLLETLSVEGVLKKEPYHIFVVTMGDDTEKAIKNFTNMMDENPAWKSLNAVQEGRIHVMDRKLFNIKPNAKWAESYEKLKTILLEEK
jgi:iron complex transport system substrate-binding protein